MKDQESRRSKATRPKRKATLPTAGEKRKEAAKVKRITKLIEKTNLDYNNTQNIFTTITGEKLRAEQALAIPKIYRATGVGKPRKLPEVDKIEGMLDKYFNDCIEQKKAPTKSGLAYSLGLLDTCSIDLAITRAKEQRLPEKPTEQQIERYYSDRLISLHLKRAMLRIEDYLQNALLTNGKSVGAIFTLKNHYGYKDVQDINSNIKSQGVVVSIAYGVPEPQKSTK